MKENKPSKNSAVNRKSDYVTNKLLLVFTLAFALLMLLMNISRMMKNTSSYLSAYTLVRVVAVVAGVATLGGIIMMIVEHAKKRDVTYKLFSGKNVTVGALFVTVCTAALSAVFSQSMLMLLYIFVPAVVVLYIIYYSYQREFFMIVLSCAIGGIGIWLLGSELINSSDMLVIAASAVGVALCVVFTVWAQVSGGMLRIFGHEFAPFKKDARYGIVYLTFVLVLMLLAASYLAADLAVYFVFGLIGYIVLTGIYYTVKLI